MSFPTQGRGAHGRYSDADANTADGNWKLHVDRKCTDMCSRLSDWLGRRSVTDDKVTAVESGTDRNFQADALCRFCR